MILSIDLETRSPVDLKRSGPYVYFEHPVTDILCLAYAIDDGPVQGWLPGDKCPDIIRAVVQDRDSEISGWNVNFERQGWRAILHKRHGWPLPVLEQFRDTAAQAAAQTLPRRLEDVAAVLRLPERKDHDGAKLMMSMAKPRKRHKGEPPGIYWNEGDLPRLLEYCKQDVVVEREIRRRLRPLSPEEMLLWRFDQLINDRGIVIDLDLVDDMREIVDKYSERLNARMAELTDGVLTTCTQTERLKGWIYGRCDVEIPSLGKGVIDSVFAHPGLDPVALQALHLWQEASKASVRKLQAAELCANGDSRARGLLRFHGANTGRWSGQLLQPHNFTRGSGLVGEDMHDFAIDMMRHRDPRNLEFCWGEPLTVISDCLRGIMTAGPGKQLYAGDYKNIEARITAWLSFNQAKLDQFQRQDAHPDDKHYEVYTISAAEIYHCAVEDIDKARRQVGKVSELALGFGGGVDAMIGMARNYHVDLAPALPGLMDAASPEERDKVYEAYVKTVETGNMKGGLAADAWLAAKFIVRAWRKANKPTVAMWDQFHRAAWHAFEGEADDMCKAGRIAFKLEKGFLWLTLPSGRRLAYPTPAVESRVVPWSDKRLPVWDQEHKDMLTVLYFLPSGHKDRYPFYPGLTFQHAVQAIARDILARGMANAEKAGFPIVMSIHDEAIAEVDANRDDLDTFLDALVEMDAWAREIPILADGWAGFRYRKV
jgi:DNA polymerase I - 3''-5'' exonuclease and polymerase domains